MADQSPTNPYIRTYAKDVASLSGSDPQAAQLSAGLAATTSGEGGRSAVLARLRARTKNEPAHENVVLPSTLPTPSAIAEPSQTPYEAPRTIPQPPAAPDAAPEGHILEEHVIEKRPEPVVPPAPLPNLPPPAPTPPPVVVTPPPAPQAPVKPSEGPSPIHTYSSDFSDRIDTKNASTFSVLAAQGDAGMSAASTAAPQPKSHKNALIIAFSFLLLVLGGAGSFAAYRYVAQRSFVPITPLVPSLVFADERQVVTGEGTTLMQAVAASANAPLPEGQVRVLYLTETTTANKKLITAPLPGGRLIGALQLSAPDILLRNIGPDSTVGIVHAGTETRAFFILRVLSYERTFAGMLGWEADMEHQLALLYPSYPEAVQPAPTTATSTVLVNGKKTVVTKIIPAAAVAPIAPRFVDEVTSNHDVRALKDGQGRTLFLYGYRDKETLILARDEAAFAELSNRLAATKQQ